MDLGFVEDHLEDLALGLATLLQLAGAELPRQTGLDKAADVLVGDLGKRLAGVEIQERSRIFLGNHRGNVHPEGELDGLLGFNGDSLVLGTGTAFLGLGPLAGDRRTVHLDQAGRRDPLDVMAETTDLTLPHRMSDSLGRHLGTLEVFDTHELRLAVLGIALQGNHEGRLVRLDLLDRRNLDRLDAAVGEQQTGQNDGQQQNAQECTHGTSNDCRNGVRVTDELDDERNPEQGQQGPADDVDRVEDLALGHGGGNGDAGGSGSNTDVTMFQQMLNALLAQQIAFDPNIGKATDGE